MQLNKAFRVIAATAVESMLRQCPMYQRPHVASSGTLFTFLIIHDKGHVTGAEVSTLRLSSTDRKGCVGENKPILEMSVAMMTHVRRGEEDIDLGCASRSNACTMLFSRFVPGDVELSL